MKVLGSGQAGLFTEEVKLFITQAGWVKDFDMARVWNVHMKNPQLRFIDQAVELLNSGGLLVCPTECSYVLMHGIADKSAYERVLKIRGLPRAHLFTLMCNSVSELSKYAKVGSSEYRILRKHCPGSFTFLLEATRQVPKRVYGPHRKTIGVRVPEHPVCRALLDRYGAPIISTTAKIAGFDRPIAELSDIAESFDSRVDGILLCGDDGLEQTTIVDLVSNPPEVIRQGRGDSSQLGVL